MATDSAVQLSHLMSFSSSIRAKPWLVAAFALLLAVAVAVAVWMHHERQAPQVEFAGIKGERISLQALHGKVVLVNFWSTSCAPCLREMPQLAATWRRLNPAGLEVVGVAASYDQPNIVVDFAETRHLPFPVALDVEGSVAHAFGGIKVVPTTYVVGRDGAIIDYVEGELDATRLAKLLERALAVKTP